MVYLSLIFRIAVISRNYILAEIVISNLAPLFLRRFYHTVSHIMNMSVTLVRTTSLDEVVSLQDGGVYQCILTRLLIGLTNARFYSNAQGSGITS